MAAPLALNETRPTFRTSRLNIAHIAFIFALPRPSSKLNLKEISPMPHMVFCAKYKAEMEGLEEPPFDSDFGQKIYKTVSKKAWGEWVERQKMLLNEYRLQPWTREAQEFLVEQMNEFFYGSGGELPKEYVAPTA
jgi:Fe-S cluster biosynthesis and repair protein YggX